MPLELQQPPSSAPTPKVSVAMITYNHEKFIAQAIESVLSQKTRFPVELIIGEDCSTDNTRAIVTGYAHERPDAIRILLHERNVGMHENSHRVVAQCRGQYFAFLEGDDVWMPDKIETQVTILEKQPKEVGFVYSDALQISENGELLPDSFIQTRSHISSPPEGYVFPHLWKGNFILLQAALFRRHALGSIEPRDNLYDWHTLLRISRSFKAVFSDVPSVKYRIHPNSMMRSGASRIDDLRVLVRLQFVEEDKTLATAELIHWLGRQLYRMRHRQRHRYLWKTFVVERTRLSFFAFLCSISGLSFNAFSALSGRGAAALSRLRKVA